MYPVPPYKRMRVKYICVFGLIPANLKSKQADRHFVLQVFLVPFRGL